MTHSPTRIALTEDNEADVLLLKTAFFEHAIDHQLDVYRDGEEAMHFARMAGSEARTPCPDLFLLDLHLPKIDGMEILHRFRENEHCKTTPVILFSSYIPPEVLTQIREIDGVQFLKKPNNLSDFLDVGRFVKDLLNHRKTADSAN